MGIIELWNYRSYTTQRKKLDIEIKLNLISTFCYKGLRGNEKGSSLYFSLIRK
jgi:hypothetical protein